VYLTQLPEKFEKDEKLRKHDIYLRYGHNANFFNGFLYVGLAQKEEHYQKLHRKYKNYRYFELIFFNEVRFIG